MLQINVFQCGPQTFSCIGIHGHRIVQRLHPIVSLVPKKTLPKDVRVVIHHIGSTKVHVHECLKRHCMGRKGDEFFWTLLVHGMPKGRSKGKYS